MSAQRVEPPARVEARRGVIEIIEAKKGDIQAAFPKGNALSVDRVIVSVRLAMSKDAKLAACDPMSIFQCVIRCAQLGLHPGGPLGEAYLVPFKDNKTGTMICTLILGYQGMIAIARRSGVVLSIDADVVGVNDRFDYEKGSMANLRHVPDLDNPGDVRGVYAIATLAGGVHQFTYLPGQEVESIRQRSKSGDSGPWKTDWTEMAKKTAIRRLFKLLPKSLEMADAMNDDDIIDVPQAQPTFAEPKNRALPNPDLAAPSILDEVVEQRAQEKPEPAHVASATPPAASVRGQDEPPVGALFSDRKGSRREPGEEG